MPDVALDILSVGEDTGELAQSMADVTEGFKESLSQRLSALTTIVSSLASRLCLWPSHTDRHWNRHQCL